jgi:hypothetical protein
MKVVLRTAAGAAGTFGLLKMHKLTPPRESRFLFRVFCWPNAPAVYAHCINDASDAPLFRDLNPVIL